MRRVYGDGTCRSRCSPTRDTIAKIVLERRIAMTTLWPVNICQHTFLPLLDRNSLVLDLGANEGDFIRGITNTFGCRIVSLEAMPHLAEAIARHPRLSLFNEAIADKTGTIQINRYEKRCASLFGPMDGETPVSVTTVKSVSLHDLIARERLGTIDLLKVDIEGAELGMFDAAPDADLLACKQITVEFHEFLYPETHDHVEKVKARLETLGFQIVRYSLDNTDVLFVNPSAGVSQLTLLWHGTAVKYSRGILRRLRRMLG
jgi:FkbM family methyltransferase